MKRYKPNVLRKFMEEVLAKLGVSENKAEIISDVFLRADLKGFSTHGLLRFPRLVKSIEEGFQIPKAKIKIEREQKNSTIINGNSGLGMVIAKKAMELAIRKAKNNSIAAVGVYNTNHFGIAGYYSELATESDMIGIAMCNTEPAMAPFSGKTPLCGTNPISIAVPTHKNPIILDMATSNVTRGKLLSSLKGKESIPEDWALDKEGNPVIYPDRIFSLLPLGSKNFSYKGFGLAFIIDILAGVLVNAQCGRNVRGTITLEKCTKGDFFIAINISRFTDTESFKSKVGQLMKDVEKDGGMYPGQREYINEKKNSLKGIEIRDTLYGELKSIGNKYNVKIL